MIKRPKLHRQIQQALKRSRVVALIGPRQRWEKKNQPLPLYIPSYAGETMIRSSHQF